MIKNIIFDLDGTLADTYKDIIVSLNYSLKKWGITKRVNYLIFKEIANKGSLYMVRAISKKNNSMCKKINDDFLHHYQHNICNKSSLKKNILNFLKYCKKNNLKLFVSTNKNEKNAILILEKLKILKYFDFIAGSDTFKYKKPSSLHLKALQKKFFFKKKETIFIGDSEVDSKSAINFKIKFILLRNGYTRMKSSEIKSHYNISNYSNISRILRIISNLSN